MLVPHEVRVNTGSKGTRIESVPRRLVNTATEN